MFEAIVYRRQEHHRRQHQLGPLPAQAVCADGTRQRLDQDLLSCLKYFVNFFFYKFGLEVRPSGNLHPLPGQDGGAMSPSVWPLLDIYHVRALEGHRGRAQEKDL